MRAGLCAVTFLLVGCDALVPEMPEPTASEAPLRFGVVHWDEVTTDCLADRAWTEDETAIAMVEGDVVTLWFDTMPELTGRLTSEGRADVAGEMTFPGETGAMVSCVVDGTTEVTGAAQMADQMAGEMHERLSSEGDLNCDSRGRYTIVFTD